MLCRIIYDHNGKSTELGITSNEFITIQKAFFLNNSLHFVFLLVVYKNIKT